MQKDVSKSSQIGNESENKAKEGTITSYQVNPEENISI